MLGHGALGEFALGEFEVASVVGNAGGFDPGFWTDEHRKIRQLEEVRAEKPGAPITEIAAIPAFIAPPEMIYSGGDDELDELLELMAIMDDHARLS